MKQLRKFLLSLTLAFPFSLLWYGAAVRLDLIFLSTIRQTGSQGADWLLFVSLHLTTWSMPFVISAVILREKLGPAFLFGVMAALLLTASLDGGELLRRAFWGKF